MNPGPTKVPFTPMLGAHRSLMTMPQHDRLELAGTLADDPSPLVRDFAASVEQLASCYSVKHPFAPAERLPRKSIRPGIQDGTDLAWHLARQRRLDVLDAEELSVRYVDFELSVLSTRGGAVFDLPVDPPMPAGRALRADLVMASVADDQPVIAEIKIGRDKDPFVALMQVLTYIAHLCTPSQWQRLMAHQPAGGFAARAEAHFDGYVLLHRFGEEPSAYLGELDHQASRIAAVLMRQAAIRRHVRRLVCLDVDEDTSSGIVTATVRWRADT